MGFLSFGSLHVLLILLIFISTLQGVGVSLNGMESVATLYENGSWLAQVQHRLINFFILSIRSYFHYPYEYLFIFTWCEAYAQRCIFTNR